MSKSRSLVTAVALFAATVFYSNSAMAEWTLDGESSNISYGTIKNGMIGESNTFKTISGTINDDGQVDIDIHLASVDTMLELRDERMRDIVFKVTENATAKLTGTIDLQAHSDQEIGTTRLVEAEIGLELVGETVEHYVTLAVTRLAENRVMVTPHGVMFVDADEYNLLSALEELRNLAGLDTIESVVPMSFYLTFTK